MENDQHKVVDLYVPRKCSSSSRIISAKDHGSIQIDFVDVDPKTGRAIPNKVTRYAICGALRAMGESDNCLVRLAQRDGLIPEKI
ncbi:40S ribosomal protein S21 [Aphelenchoides bicaudatus]|nr:40S ribosomal protein S21 [Aphelenchoides bicaudatus]